MRYPVSKARAVKLSQTASGASTNSMADILPTTGRLAMIEGQQRRGWIWIAAIAIGVALVLLLALHAHSGDAGGLVAILPLLFEGIISPLSLLSPLAFVYKGRTPDAPALAALFQRSPPFALASIRRCSCCPAWKWRTSPG